MYQVKLNTINDDLIDYDKSLKQQNDKIKKILKPYYEYYGVAETADFGTLLESTYRHLPQDEFSERLAKEGIKGIQYLDNSSRGKRFSIKLSTNKGAYDHEPIQSGDRNQIEELAEDYREKGFKVKIEEGGDKNYVIFDDKIIDIMKKYGIVGAVGVTAMQGRGNQSSEADLSL
jgi:hypothetical protein